MRKIVFILVFMTCSVLNAQTPTPTPTETPTINSETVVFAGGNAEIFYSATVGDIAIITLLSAIFLTLWAIFVFWVFVVLYRR